VRAAVLAVVLILTACGSSSRPTAQSPIQPTATAAQTPSVTASPPPTPSATASPIHVTPPAPGLLFAVVEGSLGQPGTVAIVGLNGYARAKANFQPRTGPVIPDAYVPLQGVAQVVGSGVYYIDGTGTVRVLRVGSQPQIVARFPQQRAQEDTWFAMSPDGSRALVGIFTFPALGPIIPGTSWNTLVGPSKFDLKTAPAGGQPKTLVHWETSIQIPEGSKGPTPIFPVGWTSAGSVAILPLYIESQNDWPGGPLYVIDSSGKKTKQLGGSDCDSASIARSGLIPCISSGGAVTVRDSTGKLIWATHVDGFSASSLVISPDGQAISDGLHVETRAAGMVPMPPGFGVEGWLDKNTVVGRSGGNGNLSWISLGDPTRVHNLGFKGDFVATLR
jgi:hypothetical protein